jgi:protein TonB
MSVEPGPSPQSEFASLQSCFVEGGAEQRARERRIRRRALMISVATQTAILTAIILLPLFGKPERIALANMVPIPPYVPARTPERTTSQARPTTSHQRFRIIDLLTAPDYIPPRVDTRPMGPAEEPPGIALAPATIPCVGCIAIDNPRSQPARPTDAGPQPPRRIKVTTLEPAMLMQRVEPVYPTLARQIRREGRVELRAIIATDGTIQSLQVVSGDPLFIQSAMDAVRQWRYRPTILNGRAVEIDTFITVMYNLHQ